MRIGLATHAYYPHFGGVTENVAGSAEALRELGHEVTVITAGPPVGPTVPWITRLGSQCMVPWNGATVNFTYGWRLERELAAVMRDRALDVVHVHCPLAPMLPLAAVRAASDASIPVVGTFHATASWNIGYQVFQRLLRPYCARIDRKLAVSRPARAFVSRYFPGDYEIVPNGVDIDRFGPPERAAGIVAQRPTILYVGRLDPRKGVSHLIDAMPLVASAIHNVRLVVIGNGPRRRRLVARAARVAPRWIDFVGSVPPSELPDHFTRAAAVCCPATHNESFGIVLLEAMAAALPVVATDISGYRLLVEDGVTGCLVPPGESDRLAAALIRVLADGRLARRLGQAGRRQAERYSWQVVGERLETIYGELLGQDVRRDRVSELVAVETV